MLLPLPEGTVRGPENRPKEAPQPPKRVMRREPPKAKPEVVELDNAARLDEISRQARLRSAEARRGQPPKEAKQPEPPSYTQDELDSARREFADRMQKLQ